MRRKLATIFCLLCVTNFVVFLLIDVAIGGDALNGKVENGRYFLSQNDRYTEVSKPVWTYSRIHGAAAMAGWGLAIVIGIVSGVGRRRVASPANAVDRAGE